MKLKEKLATKYVIEKLMPKLTPPDGGGEIEQALAEAMVVSVYVDVYLAGFDAALELACKHFDSPEEKQESYVKLLPTGAVAMATERLKTLGNEPI